MKKLLASWKKRFLHINPRLMIIHLIITLAYPAAKALISERNRLLIFSDSLTYVSLLLVIAGVVYSLYLHGDFDISGFLLKRGVLRKKEEGQSFEAYMADRKEKREAAFNYPLFLGILGLAVSAFLAWVVI